MSKEKINGIKVGDVFTVAGMEFIRFPEVSGKVPVVMKGCAFRSEFGDGTDLRESSWKRRCCPRLSKLWAKRMCAPSKPT